jgi:hypothetical protein
MLRKALAVKAQRANEPGQLGHDPRRKGGLSGGGAERGNKAGAGMEGAASEAPAQGQAARRGPLGRAWGVVKRVATLGLVH